MILSYLVEATVLGYDPACDRDHLLRDERVAAVRLLIWGMIGVGEMAVRQSQRTDDAKWRNALFRMVAIQLPEFRPPAGLDLERRVEVLTRAHADPEDCRIVAEAEVLDAPALITFDKRMIRRLARLTAVPLCTPTEYWLALCIPPGTPPRWPPRDDNPLAHQPWWRWD